MVKKGLESFRGKHVLLLQGPVGPFFKYLAQDLMDIGATVNKINFNGGDSFFYSGMAIDYTGTLEGWPHFFADFIESHWIDTVMLFGDCREYHRIAHAIAHKNGIDIGVFEEGYIRPDYITFEEFGVNGHSQLSRSPDFYRFLEEEEFFISKTVSVGKTFWYAAWFAILYYLFSALAFPKFRHYRHHRSLSPWEAIYWIRSAWRKQWYKIKENGIMEDALNRLSKQYFLVPLQISTDAQVREHSNFVSIENFIEKIIASFSACAPKETWLLIKHHPLDRGYHDYSDFIMRTAKHHHVDMRVKYIHDQYLPALLEHARGVIVINSTVGLSAIHHNTPLMACGSAIYDLEGLTYQGKLDQFWDESKSYKCDRDLYHRFGGYVINNKQINGNFYRRIKKSQLKSGIIW